ncbi:hypothetical protein Tco_1471431, partial [Tanacetum coccineum]
MGLRFLDDKLVMEEIMGHGSDIQEKDKKKAKNKENRAQSGKDQVKSKVIHMKKIQLEGLKLPNLKLYYKRKRQ